MSAFADQLAALMPDRRLRRLRDARDIEELAGVLAHAFGVGALQVAIAAAIAQRRASMGDEE
jgi:hypothetical protein